MARMTDKKFILLWGLSQDSPLAAVHEALLQRDAHGLFVDQQDVLVTEVELFADADVTGILRVDGQCYDLSAVTAAYVRPYDSRQLPCIADAGEASPAWSHAMGIDRALLSWLELTPAFVLNRPSAMASNNSKPYQTSLIRLFGFETPDTLITTDPNAAREFFERHGTVIYKSISAIRSIVARVTSEHLSRLGDVTWCPTQFQQYIQGEDYRIHVVGEEVFASHIVSGADDYRYASRSGIGTRIVPYDLCDECVEQCRALTRAMGLSMAGIDLRRSSDDRWYCFEVNPSPGFTYYQEATNQAIDQAVARLLVEGF